MTNYDNNYSNSLNPDEKKDVSLDKEQGQPTPSYYTNQQPPQPTFPVSPYNQPQVPQQQSPYGQQPSQPQQGDYGQPMPPSPYGAAQSPYNQPQQQSPYGQPQQQSYNQPQQGYNQQQGFGAYPVQVPTNKSAITGIILSGVGFLLGWAGGITIIASIIGIIFGHKALREIGYSGEKGKGLAITALVLGYLTVLSGFLFVLLFIFLGVMDSSSY